MIFTAANSNQFIRFSLAETKAAAAASSSKLAAALSVSLAGHVIIPDIVRMMPN